MPQQHEKLTFMVENARLLFRNFSGRETMYNVKGSKNFAVVLDWDTAKQMKADGWNVKGLDPKSRTEEEDEDVKDPYISVQLGYSGHRPPLIVMITSNGRTILDESTVEILDSVDISYADVICNASFWQNNSGSGIKAYLKTMYVTIEEDALQRKYALQDEMRDNG